MKRALLTILSVLFCAITFAQSVPQGINYQAVARDANGDVLINQALTIQFSVISDITTSAVSWQETQQDTTNDYGLFTAIIGQGTTTSVGSSLSFDVIDWGSSNHFLKVEVDYGSGLVDMGTTAFMSVPYALHAGSPGPADSSVWIDAGSVVHLADSGDNVVIGNAFATNSAYGLVNGISNAKVLSIQAATSYTDESPSILELQGSSSVDGDEIGIINFVQKASFGPNYNFARISAHRENSNATHSSLRFYTRKASLTTQAMKIDEDANVEIAGNVRVGTTAGSEKVTIRGTGSSSATNSFLVENSTGADIFKIRDDVRVAIGTSPNTSYQLYNNVPDSSIVSYAQRNFFYRNNTLKSGTMYGSYNYTYRGSLASSGVVYGVYGYTNNDVGASTTYGIRSYTAGNSTGSKYGIYCSTGGSGSRYAGYFVGDVYSSGSYLPSDESLKRNISDYDNALDQLSSIEVKEYEYKHEGDMSKMDLPKGKQVGIMAQNIENVFPQLTKESEFDLNDDPENEDENREENTFKFKAVNYTGMIPVTVKAIQEQQEMIKNQQELIKKLEERITQLENN